MGFCSSRLLHAHPNCRWLNSSRGSRKLTATGLVCCGTFFETNGGTSPFRSQFHLRRWPFSIHDAEPPEYILNRASVRVWRSNTAAAAAGVLNKAAYATASRSEALHGTARENGFREAMRVADDARHHTGIGALHRRRRKVLQIVVHRNVMNPRLETPA